MKLLILSTCDNLIRGDQKPLEDSLIKQGFEYDFFLYGFIFGEQYKVIKTYVDQYKGDATHICYVDAYDNIALGTPEEVIRKFNSLDCRMLISAEKACFPNDPRDKYHRPENYPETNSLWKYINGGGCMFEIEYFKELCNKHPFNTERMMDPDWLAELYMNNKEVKLDNQCEIFQCLAHSNQDEWDIEDKNFGLVGFFDSHEMRIKNKATNTYPIFIHGNGRTDMQWLRDIA